MQTLKASVLQSFASQATASRSALLTWARHWLNCAGIALGWRLQGRHLQAGTPPQRGKLRPYPSFAC